MNIVENSCPECSEQIYKSFVQKDKSVWVEKNTFEQIKHISNDNNSINCPHCLIELKPNTTKKKQIFTYQNVKTC